MNGAPPLPHRRWPLWIVLLGLVPAAIALASWLGWVHLHATHGDGSLEGLCSADATFDCGAVHLSRWGEWRGVPTSVWAIPLHVAVAVWSAVGLRADARGARARGGALALAALAVGVSALLLGVMVVEVGALCMGCLGLDAIHVGILGALLLAGARRPAVPEGLDVFFAGASVIVSMGFSFQLAIITGDWLDRTALAAADPRPVDETVVAERLERDRVVVLPARGREVPTDRFDPTSGPRRTKVTVVTFVDFECAYCRKLADTLASLHVRYADRVRFVVKHFPQDAACNPRVSGAGHPGACAAAGAAVCATDQGEFWAMQEALFQTMGRRSPEDLGRLATRLGLDRRRFDGCLDDPGVQEQILEDISHAGYAGVDGTPRTFVNGRPFSGAVSEAILDAAIRAELGELEVQDGERVETALRVVDEASPPIGPVEMVRVAPGLAIDAVEASVVDGRAVSWAGVAPATGLDWHAASAACAAAGKRMCTVAEWMLACAGRPAEDEDDSESLLDDLVEGRRLPYGRFWVEGRCVDGAEAVGPAAGAAGCRTPEGIYDLAGNAQEWVGADPLHVALMGGGPGAGERALCGGTDLLGAGAATAATGFRCCADAPVPAGAIGSDGPRPVAVAPASTLPDVALRDAQAQPVDLRSFQGRPLVVNLWATWCAPCREELPLLGALAGRGAADGFSVVTVNVDRAPAVARRFLASISPAPPTYYDADGALVGKLQAAGLPLTLVYASDGALTERIEGGGPEAISRAEAAVRSLVARGDTAR